MERKRPIVVLGGMGPQASLELYRLIIEKSALQYEARENEQYPHVIIDSLAVPDFISNKSRQDEAIQVIQNAVTRALTVDPIAVAVSCNTAHLFAKEAGLLNVKVPFVSLIEVVSRVVASSGLKRVGLLASPTTIETRLYDRELTELGVECVVLGLSEQLQAEEVIRKVIAGKASENHASILTNQAKLLTNKGAQGVVLGCTELPLIFRENSVDFPVFDCLDILSSTLLERYYRYLSIERASLK